jgi:sugar O-acyltransferase (sialic acid O-acetyltransferase NeuD family)
MSKPFILLLGAGGHAHACIDVIEQQGQFNIAGLIGMSDELGEKHLGYSVIATDHDLPDLCKNYQYLLIAVGQIRSSDQRAHLYSQVRKLGFILPVIIAPTAYVSSHAIINAGTIVMHNSMVNSGAKIGVNCIINSRALIEHDAWVGDHCHISTGALLNGHVNIGNGSFVGSGSVVKEGVSIGVNCTIGMGLSVRHNQVENTRYVGGGGHD